MKELSALVKAAERVVRHKGGSRQPSRRLSSKGAELVAERRLAPLDPGGGHVLGAPGRDPGRALDDARSPPIGWQMISAGHSTTTRALTSRSTISRRTPTTRRGSGPTGRIPTAVEELLRIGPPLHLLARTVSV